MLTRKKSTATGTVEMRFAGFVTRHRKWGIIRNQDIKNDLVVVSIYEYIVR